MEKFIKIWDIICGALLVTAVSLIILLLAGYFFAGWEPMGIINFSVVYSCLAFGAFVTWLVLIGVGEWHEEKKLEAAENAAN